MVGRNSGVASMSNEIKKREAQTISDAFDSIAAIFITDPKGCFIYVNDIFCELTGYTKTELIGKSPNVFKSGLHPEEFYKKLWSALLSGETWRGVFCNKKKNGELVWLDTIIRPIFNNNNEIEKFVGIRFNVTENVQNKLALKAKEEELVAISKFATMGEISGFVAHEINNPLTVMSLAASSIHSALNAESPDIQKIKKLNTKMIEVTNRISHIVLALRDYSRNDSTSIMDSCRVSEIIDDALLITEYIAKSNGVDLIVENDVDDELLIKCRRTQISQVLINLIKNACDAVHSLEKMEVKLKITVKSDALEIRVLDSGIRIPDEVVARLFTPYFTTKEKGKGTGIGLTLSAKIIEAHGGKIFLDRECHQTCFVVTIPLA